MNRTAIVIIGLVVFLCACFVVIAAAAGFYFLGQPSSTPLIGITTLSTPSSRAPSNLPNIAPPAFPTVTGGGMCDEIAELDDQGADHIRPGQAHPPYNSNPPTSGWHWASPQEWGIYTAPQVQEQLVHNLEHGGIVIQYNNLSAAELQRLLDFVKRTPRHIIVAPYPGLDRGVRVAFTAWTYLQNCSGVDLDALADFIDEFRDQGPETVP